MTTATLTLWIIALVLLFIAWRRQDGSLARGAQAALVTGKRNAVLLLIAFLIVGLVEVLAPTELVRSWIGPGSGWCGLLLAEGIGMVLPGGPYVVFPLIATLYAAGAGIGPAVAMITSWSTQALLTISFELPFLGWRFTAIRWGLGLIIPLLAGALAQILI